MLHRIRREQDMFLRRFMAHLSASMSSMHTKRHSWQHAREVPFGCFGCQESKSLSQGELYGTIGTGHHRQLLRPTCYQRCQAGMHAIWSKTHKRGGAIGQPAREICSRKTRLLPKMVEPHGRRVAPLWRLEDGRHLAAGPAPSSRVCGACAQLMRFVRQVDKHMSCRITSLDCWCS